MARAIARSWEGHVSRRLRKKIEMLFAHLKRILKLDRLRLRGPNGARDEFLLAATAQNLRKLAKADTDAARKARLWEQFSSAIDYAVAGMAQSTAHFLQQNRSNAAPKRSPGDRSAFAIQYGRLDGSAFRSTTLDYVALHGEWSGATSGRCCSIVIDKRAKFFAAYFEGGE
jgi:hypothetical protein